MNAMKNKIISQRGASITFALLLFLVCAIISSVVIVAATAVGGRASKMAELDQRYYAVNSAAELLRDVLEQQIVTVAATTQTVSTLDQDDKVIVEGVPSGPTYNMALKSDPTDIPISASDTSLVATAACKLTGQTADEKTLSLSAELGGTTQSALAVTMTPSIDVGNRKLYVTVANTNATTGTYTLGLTFKADIVQNINERTTYSAPLPMTDESGKIIEGKYKRTEKVEETTVSTIRWKLVDMKIVTAAPSSTSTPGGA